MKEKESKHLGRKNSSFLSNATFPDLKRRGMIDTVIVERALLEVLEAPLTIYQGFDPTSPNLHLGHLVALRTLRWFQLHGHRVIFLIGDFTGRIGDPTDKNAARRKLTHEEVLKNAATYREQAAKVLDFEGDNPVSLQFNSAWLDGLTFNDVIELAALLTVQQMEERDMFEERKRRKRPIYLHEFLYPLMQGYDSVALNVDIELGGRDQLFNMLVGRDLVKSLQGRDKHIITTPLLPGLDGRKMGKSEGNTVDLTESATSMFFKLTLVQDKLLPLFMSILTDSSDSRIAEINERLERGEFDLRDAREEFAFTVVNDIYAEPDAISARDEFRRVVAEGQLPTDIEVVRVHGSELSLADVLTITGLAPSKAQARRLVAQGGVKINGVRQEDPAAMLSAATLDGALLQCGRRNIVRVATN